MKHIRAQQGPQLRLDVSDKEREAAKNVKKGFKTLLKDFDASLSILFDLREALVDGHPSKDDLEGKFRGRFLRYRSKIVKSFNALLEQLKLLLESMGAIMDPEMAKLRNLIMSEFDEASDGVESMLSLLKEPGRKEFTKSIERICTQMQQRRTSIGDVIESQLFNHLEHDILGKLKISSLTTRVMTRTRLLRKLATEK